MSLRRPAVFESGSVARLQPGDGILASTAGLPNLIDSLAPIYSVAFDGVADVINFGTTELAFGSSTPFSVVHWAKSAHAGTSRTVLGRRTFASGWEVGHSAGSQYYLSLRAGAGNQVFILSSAAYAGSTWRQFVWTYDGSSAASGVGFSVNGSPAALTTSEDTLTGSMLAPAGTPFALGARGDATSYWDGQLNEVQVYDKVLSAGEITAIYNGGVIVSPLVLSTSGNLLKYLRVGTGDSVPFAYDVLQGPAGGMVNLNSQSFMPDVP